MEEIVMNDSEKDLVLKVSQSNAQLRRLYTQHLNIDKKLSDYKNRNFLTNDEQMEAKLLKKQKLYKKDQMMELLASNA
jgi:uncharacterized protein YdcH (DUF465 family)